MQHEVQPRSVTAAPGATVCIAADIRAHARNHKHSSAAQPHRACVVASAGSVAPAAVSVSSSGKVAAAALGELGSAASRASEDLGHKWQMSEDSFGGLAAAPGGSLVLYRLPSESVDAEETEAAASAGAPQRAAGLEPALADSAAEAPHSDLPHEAVPVGSSDNNYSPDQQDGHVTSGPCPALSNEGGCGSGTASTLTSPATRSSDAGAGCLAAPAADMKAAEDVPPPLRALVAREQTARQQAASSQDVDLAPGGEDQRLREGRLNNVNAQPADAPVRRPCRAL